MTKKTTTNQKSVEAFKAASQRVAARQAAQAAKDAARHESEPVKIAAPLSVAAYNKAMLDAMPNKDASFEIETAFYAEAKPVQVIAGPAATVEKTESGKKAAKAKAEKVDKKANMAESVLAEFGVKHGARITNDVELWTELSAGKKVIVCRIGKPSEPFSPDYTFCQTLQHTFDPDKMTFDKTSVIARWLGDTTKADKGASRVFSVDNIRHDAMNWKLVHIAKDWQPVTIFKA